MEHAAPLANPSAPQEFWNAYHHEKHSVDWIIEPSPELIDLLFPSCSAALNVLEIGAGTSTLADSLARSRPTYTVVSTDVSPVAISQALSREPGPPENLEYRVLDAVSPKTTAISADVVLDKVRV